MTITTVGVGASVTPTVVSAFVSHFSKKPKRTLEARKKGYNDSDPNTELAYTEGIRIIRSFLAYAAKHPVEDVQSFTAAHVPSPTWVRVSTVKVPHAGCIDKAETLLERQLKSYGQISLERVGGANWWKCRGRELEGEWIEMKKDYVARQAALKSNDTSRNERVMLYVHGGGGIFSSLDTHRYQIQRHARKLGGRAFSPSYRLAPQYPFPCAILDVLASYLFLIEPPPSAADAPISPSNIVLAGDSAGGNLILALLMCIRDLGLPMPAGADLLSPWVDLSHSFPSVLSNADTDYIPGNGFHFKPSLAWPPVRGAVLVVDPDSPNSIEIDEQVQMYCPNDLLSHPLVSPVNAGSLGGLCPLLVHSGDGELLRDEQIYLAHKAAEPERYPPSKATLADYPGEAESLKRWSKGTKVQLQVYDGCAHVIPTLAICRPAKYMYRSAANFNIWAITMAQKKASAKHSKLSLPSSRSSTLDTASNDGGSPTSSIGRKLFDEKLHSLTNQEPVQEDDRQSEASDSSSDSESDDEGVRSGYDRITVTSVVPPFGSDNIIRQRVNCGGRIRKLEAREELPALCMDPEHIGRVGTSGPISKWLETRKKYETKYAKETEKFRAIKAEDYAKAQQAGFLTRDLHGENPPQCALVSWYDPELARKVGKSVDEVGAKTNAAVMMWGKLSSKPDEQTLASNGDLANSGNDAKAGSIEKE